MRDEENFESFFVRPHQVGNPDAIQYTPVFNGISSWQLYHGPGFWAPIEFPLDDWFRIRVVFAGQRAEVYVADLEVPALAIRELKGPVEPGRVGVFVGGPAVHLADFAYEPGGNVAFRAPPPPRLSRSRGSFRSGGCRTPFPRRPRGKPRSSSATHLPPGRGRLWPASLQVSSTWPE